MYLLVAGAVASIILFLLLDGWVVTARFGVAWFVFVLFAASSAALSGGSLSIWVFSLSLLLGGVVGLALSYFAHGEFRDYGPGYLLRVVRERRYRKDVNGEGQRREL